MHSYPQGRFGRYCGGIEKFKFIGILHAVYCNHSLISHFKLVFIDVSNPNIIAPHPMHMHGHEFFVVAMERHVDNITLGTYLDNSDKTGLPPAFRPANPARISKAVRRNFFKSALLLISIPSIGWLMGSPNS